MLVFLALPHAKEDVARTQNEKWAKPVVTDEQRRSSRKEQNERAFWKKGKGCVHSAHDFHILTSFYSFLYFPFLLWKSTLSPFLRTITFIKTFMQNYPLLLLNSIKYFFNYFPVINCLNPNNLCGKM